MNLSQSKQRLGRQPLLWLATVLGATAILVACGGGGGSAGVTGAGAGTTATMARGPITGFGSVIVNGVRFDDNGAEIFIDDDVKPENELRLGMMVEIEGDLDASNTTGKAKTINVASQVKGPISAKNATTATTGTLTVLGLKVTVNAHTVFEDAAGFADLNVNDIVEIHAIADGQCALLATRIEKEQAMTPPIDVRITGTIKGLNTGKTSFTLDNGCATNPTVNVDPVATRIDNPPLVEGTVVRVKGTIPTADSLTISATRIKARKEVQEAMRVELEGIVSDFNSLADFKIGGQKVDASKATKIEGTIVNGARAEAEGMIVGGVLVAAKVEAEDENEAVENEVFMNELHGLISGFAGKTFQLRHTTVTFDNNTVFTGLTAADLANGLNVEVKGVVTGNAVLATTIKMEN